MMYRTVIRNIEGTEDEPGRQNWRVRLGKLYLRCPVNDEWFRVPSDVTVDKDGNLSDSLHHICDAGDDDDSEGWVVLAQLEGWRS